MREDPFGWETPLRWAFSIEMAAPTGAPSGSPQSWSHTRFLPELGGGLIEDWESTAGVRITPTHFEFDGPGPVTFSGHLRTAGKVQEAMMPGAAVVKLVHAEPESDTLRGWLADRAGIGLGQFGSRRAGAGSHS